jgi:DNA polymerase-3 subunit delta'
MIWQKIRNVSPQVEQFRRSIVRGRLSHAYLFVGPEGVGKKQFARALVQCLFCTRFENAELEACGECPACRQMLAGTHPDYLEIGCPPGKRVLPIELIAGDDEHRGQEGLCHDLSLRPMSADRRIAVIDDAHTMNEPSANALLKTLEEPPADALLILIAASADALLPTIRSRCQLIRFARLPDGDLLELLLDLELAADHAEAAAIVPLCQGSLAVAAQLTDPALRDLRRKLYAALAAEPFDSVATAAELLAGIEGIGGDTAAQRQTASWLIRFAVEFYRQAALLIAEDAEIAVPAEVRAFGRRWTPGDPEGIETCGRLLERAALSSRQIEQSMPVPLCLEGLCADLGRLQRAAI